MQATHLLVEDAGTIQVEKQVAAVDEVQHQVQLARRLRGTKLQYWSNLHCRFGNLLRVEGSLLMYLRTNVVFSRPAALNWRKGKQRTMLPY